MILTNIRFFFFTKKNFIYISEANKLLKKSRKRSQVDLFLKKNYLKIKVI